MWHKSHVNLSFSRQLETITERRNTPFRTRCSAYQPLLKPSHCPINTGVWKFTTATRRRAWCTCKPLQGIATSHGLMLLHHVQQLPQQYSLAYCFNLKHQSRNATLRVFLKSLKPRARGCSASNESSNHDKERSLDDTGEHDAESNPHVGAICCTFVIGARTASTFETQHDQNDSGNNSNNDVEPSKHFDDTRRAPCPICRRHID